MPSAHAQTLIVGRLERVDPAGRGKVLLKYHLAKKLSYLSNVGEFSCN